MCKAFVANVKELVRSARASKLQKLLATSSDSQARGGLTQETGNHLLATSSEYQA
jgi:hypothetical protein